MADDAEEDVKKAHIMQIRVEQALWKRFKGSCLRNDARRSEVVREFMRAMVREERGLSKTLDEAQRALEEHTYTDVGAVAKVQHEKIKNESKDLWSL